MDSVDLLRRTVTETDRIVQGLSEDQLALQTPCTEWKVRDLLNHITSGATMFAVSAEQGSVPDDLAGQLMSGDNLGEDFKASWSAASRRAVEAFEDPGVMEKNLRLPFGEMPAPIALNIAVMDVTTHLCDLAKATGAEIGDQALVAEALGMAKQSIGPEMRNPGFFDAEKPCDPAAPVTDQLLAFMGRDV